MIDSARIFSQQALPAVPANVKDTPGFVTYEGLRNQVPRSYLSRQC
jgi:hypothetical protein